MVRSSGVDSESLRKSKRFWTSAGSTVTVGSSAAALKRTTLSWRNSGRVSWAAFSFMKACSWASVGFGGSGTMLGLIRNQLRSRPSSA